VKRRRGAEAEGGRIIDEKREGFWCTRRMEMKERSIPRKEQTTEIPL
jgi:hypothetical protein